MLCQFLSRLPTNFTDNPRTCFITNARQYTIVYTYTEARSINRCTVIWHSRHIGPFRQSFLLLLLPEDWFTRIIKTDLLYCLNKRKEKTFNLMILVRNKILCRQHNLAIIDRFPYADMERISGGGSRGNFVCRGTRGLFSVILLCEKLDFPGGGETPNLSPFSSAHAFYWRHGLFLMHFKWIFWRTGLIVQMIKGKLNNDFIY